MSPVNILAVTTIVNFKRCQTHLLPVQVLKNAGTHFPKLNRVQFGQTFPRCHPTGFQIFIALIHPIQWTIALPVGADRPAKRQKKSPYMSA